MTLDDAMRCIDAGVKGIAVSNHGGRRQDHTAGTAEVLPAIAAKLKGKIPILTDGCVATGSDILKYLALGADVVMVKPAGSYLDILRTVADSVDVPVWAYQVSGEYSMVEAAAAAGWIDRDRAILETLTGIRRAGASTVLTYWATEVAGWLREGR